MTVRLIDAGRYMLRPLEDEDAYAMAEAVRESAASISRWMDWAHAAYTPDEALAWIVACREARADGVSHEFGVFDPADGCLVGAAGLNRIDALHGTANLGYWTRASRQRQGVALAATRALQGFAFETLGLTRVEIVVAEGNEGSVAVARLAGGSRECLALNRLRVGGRPVPAHVFALLPLPAGHAS
jgi:RimJ/RimL family protein N-acetyltransferase